MLRELTLVVLLLPAATVGTIAFMSPKGLRTVEDDGTALTSIGKDFAEPQEDNCGMAVDATRRLAIWSEGYYDPAKKQTVGKIWRMSLDATASDSPVLVASGDGMRLFGLVIDAATESVYVSRYFSSKGGYYIYKVDAYSTAAGETISDSTHKWASFKGGQEGGGMVISGGFLYLPTAQDGAPKTKLLYRIELVATSPKVDTIETLDGAMMPDDFVGSITAHDTDGVLLISTSDEGNYPGVVYEYNAATDTVTNLYDGIVPEFVTSRPRNPNAGASLPSIAAITSSPGQLILGSGTGIEVVTLGKKSASIFTSTQADLGPFVYFAGVPPTDSPGGPTDAPIPSTDVPATTGPQGAGPVTQPPATGAPDTLAPGAPPVPPPVTPPVVKTPAPATFQPLPPNGKPPPAAADPEEKDDGDSGLVTILIICLTLVALCVAGAGAFVYMQRSKDQRAAQAAMSRKDDQITALLQEQRRQNQASQEAMERAIEMQATKEAAPLPPQQVDSPRRVSLAEIPSPGHMVSGDHVLNESGSPMASPRASPRGLAPSELNMSIPNFSVTGSMSGSPGLDRTNMSDYPLVFWPGLQSAQAAQMATNSGRVTQDHSNSPLYQRIVAMYETHNPGKMHTVDALVNKYGEDALLKTLVDKYGPEPTDGSALRTHFDSSSRSVHLSPMGSPAGSPMGSPRGDFPQLVQ
ncbi:hypothetical protein DIPPA_13595 [Diplonema papillatum]|nr:hypothetical protein DIPPA_13595 [Diplonema papillatum]